MTRLCLITIWLCLICASAKAQSERERLLSKTRAYFSFDHHITEQIHGGYPNYRHGIIRFREGYRGEALSFESDSSFIEIPNSLTVLQDSMAMSMWFFVDSLPLNYNVLIDKTKGSDYVAYITPEGELKMEFVHLDETRAVAQHKITLKKWHMLTVNVGSGSFGLYIDGERVDRAVMDPQVVRKIPGVLGAGGSPYSPGYQFHGAIDEVLFFDAYLSDDEIKLLFEEGIELLSVLIDMTKITSVPRDYDAFVQRHPELNAHVDSLLEKIHEVSLDSPTKLNFWHILNYKLTLNNIQPPSELLMVNQPVLDEELHEKPQDGEPEQESLSWVFFLVIGLILALFLLLYLKARKPLKRNDLRRLNEEIELQKDTISQLAVQTIERGRFIYQIGESLKHVREQSNEPHLKEQISELQTKVWQSALKQKDTREMEDKAKAYHEAFAHQIKRMYPNLTKNDLRLIGLIRAGMSSKEISSILNIAPASVDTSRHRLRKKMKLDKGEDLLHFLKSIKGD